MVGRTAGQRHGWVSMTTDYGLDDGFVAVCHGVIARFAPQVRILDVSHGIPPQAVRAGAEVLAQAVPYLPEAVHLVVVDPGVGTGRRGLVVVAEHGVLVGPDNGVLLPATQALEGVRAAFALTESRWWLPEVSRTFHGRDVFAPVAARLADGMDPSLVGERVDPAGLVRLPEPVAEITGSRVRAEVVTVDRFGSLQLAVDAGTPGWAAGAAVTVQGRAATVAETFADVPAGQLLVLADSTGHLAVAVNGGSAAQRLDAECGSIIEIGPA